MIEYIKMIESIVEIIMLSGPFSNISLENGFPLMSLGIEIAYVFTDYRILNSLLKYNFDLAAGLKKYLEEMDKRDGFASREYVQSFYEYVKNQIPGKYMLA